MEKRKNPEKDLKKLSGLFFQIGLLTAMMLAVSAFEYRVEKIEPPVASIDGNSEEIFNLPITEIKPPQPPPPKRILPNPVVEATDITEVKIPDIVLDPVIPSEPVYEPPIELEDEKVDVPFLFVEEMPKPEGGMDEFYKFINKNLKYPGQARRLDIEGTVYVVFVVDEKGNMTDIKILKGIGAGCDEEVLRIFQNPPKWQPGKQRGVPVKVRQTIPIKFELN